MTVATKKRATIKDVAREAGMSLGTVSGVLNGDAKFTEPTRRKVWEAANGLGYRPNAQAQNLRSGGEQAKRQKSGIILHITHLGGDSPVGCDYESARSTLLAWEAGKLGLYPLTYWYHRLKGFQCPPVINGHVDGAIVGTPHLQVVETLRELLPMVLMDVPFSPETADVPMVNTDWRQGFMRLFARLRELGHKRVGTLCAADPGEGRFNELVVFEALLAAAKANGVEIHPECRPVVKVSPETHDQVMAEIAAHFAAHVRAGDVSAVVCPNHSYSDSFLQLFPKLGLRTPEDVFLASAYTSFGERKQLVCAVGHDWPGLVKTSLEVLKNLIDGNPPYCREFLVRPEFHPGTMRGGVL